MNSMSIESQIQNVNSALIGSIILAFSFLVSLSVVMSLMINTRWRSKARGLAFIGVSGAVVCSMAAASVLMMKSYADTAEKAKAQVEGELADIYGPNTITVHGPLSENVDDRELMVHLGGYQEGAVNATVKLGYDQYMYGVELHGGTPVLTKFPSTNAPNPDELKGT